MRTEMATGEKVKKTYSTPKLTTHGDLSTLTQSLDGKGCNYDYAGCASHFFDTPWYNHLQHPPTH